MKEEEKRYIYRTESTLGPRVGPGTGAGETSGTGGGSFGPGALLDVWAGGTSARGIFLNGRGKGRVNPPQVVGIRGFSEIRS